MVALQCSSRPVAPSDRATIRRHGRHATSPDPALRRSDCYPAGYSTRCLTESPLSASSGPILRRSGLLWYHDLPAFVQFGVERPSVGSRLFQPSTGVGESSEGIVGRQLASTATVSRATTAAVPVWTSQVARGFSYTPLAAMFIGSELVLTFPVGPLRTPLSGFQRRGCGLRYRNRSGDPSRHCVGMSFAEPRSTVLSAIRISSGVPVRTGIHDISLYPVQRPRYVSTLVGNGPARLGADRITTPCSARET